MLLPLWRALGFGLGAATAALGTRAAMACTVAVEDVISQHYNDQLRVLLAEPWRDEHDLRRLVREFRDDELEHKHTGLEHEAELAPMYRAMSAVIKAGCHAAIFVTERI